MAIWPIALIDRLRFLFLSPLFLVRTFTKANFCLAPPLPPTSPSSAVPIELLQLKIYFYLDAQHEIKTQMIDRHCAVRAREGWLKKLCSLVITIRTLGVILSDFYLLEISNHCHINKKVLSSKTSLSVKNQTLNKALLQKIHRSTKNIHTSFFMQPHITLRIRCTKINVLWNFTSITMTLFSITLKLVSFFCLN